MSKITSMVLILSFLTLGTIALMSCDTQPKGEPIVPEYNNNLDPPKSITIPTFDWYIVSEAEMRDVYERSGQVIPEGGELKGITGLNNGQQVVITPPPVYVDDEVACTLGHEVMHIAFGDYHKAVSTQR